jgi:hypothetical protein
MCFNFFHTQTFKVSPLIDFFKFLSLLSIILKNWIGQIDEIYNLTKSSYFHYKQKMLPPKIIVLVQNGVKKI